MNRFQTWLRKRNQVLFENMWGQIPTKTRKPSDGWRGRTGAMPAPTAGANPIAQKMKKK